MVRKLAVAVGLVAALLIPSPAHATSAGASKVSAVPLYLGPVDATDVVARPARIAPAVTAVLQVSSYRVVPGDTLGAIARWFCGRFDAYPALAAASGISNPDLIFPGQTIRLACSGAPAAAPARTAIAPVLPPASSGRAAAVVAWALAQVGKPYLFGAAGPRAFDCSGLAMASYATVGIRLPHNAAEILWTGLGTRVGRADDLRPGDLIWPYSGLGHVVIYIGGGRIVEAPHAGASVRTTALYGFYTARRYV